MNNGDPHTPTVSSPTRTLAPLRTGPSSLLWKMLAIALLAHLLIMLVTSRSLYGTDAQSPEQIFEKGERAFAAGQYLEAMEHYRRVLDLQPKLPPIFEKAADQHRNAERLAKQKAATLATSQESTPASPTSAPTPTSRITVTPTKAAPTTDQDLPPEFRPK